MLRTWTPKYLATAINDRRRLPSILTQLVLVVAMASLGAIGVKSSLAAASGGVTSFCSSSGTTISDSAAPPTKAGSYPSTATVSGVIGTVTHMTITLQNLSHTFPDDVDILLVGPGGQNAIILSDVGGTTGAVNVTLTLDDNAGSSLPDTGPLVAGAFKPTNIGAGDVFPAPAPAPSGGSALSAFNGTDPNGTWKLYIVDDTAGDSGAITDWCMTFDTTISTCSLTCPGNRAQDNDPGQCGAVVTYPAPTAGGTCGAVSCDRPSGSFFPIGTTTVTCTALGGPSCVFDVTVNLTASASCQPCITAPVTITDGTTPPTAASPYPSNVIITGKTGVVSKVFVTLTGLNHSFVDDVDILLVGPGGQNAIILSDVGGGTSATNVNLTLDDAAGSSLPDGAPLVSGTFKPSNFTPSDAFPAPAPAPSGGSALSAFNGTDPNGIWKLYILDDVAGNSGTLTGGWCLTITTVNPNCSVSCPADVARDNDAGVCSANVTYPAPGTTGGGCGTVTCTPASGSSYPIGTTQVTCTAAAGPSCAFNVTVNATPSAVCSSCAGSVTIADTSAPTKALPYPSTVFLTGIGGYVTWMTVRLNDLSHPFPEDMDMLLVGPGGQNAIILSDVGGTSAASHVTLTLDDAAGSSLPGAGPLVSGTFKPSDFAPADTFPAPAPSPSGGSALSAFTATNPNGTWSLYVVDDTTGDSGTLGGWCLDTNYSCVGAPASICDDGNVCTDDSCNTSTGRCVHANNSSACDDLNACTQTDTCQAGSCVGSNPVACTASDQCHSPGACNSQTGACMNPAKSDGTACNDGSACSQTDTCQAGVCTGGNPVTCPAQDQCHSAGVCNPATGVCTNPAKSNGTACNDGNACLQTDTCQAGVCIGGNPVVCTAQDQCHSAGTCNPATGACSNPQLADGAVCNDANACTQTDTCQSGSCVGGNSVTCAAQDQCHSVGTCNPQTGVCSNPQAANGTVCNDSNACTQTDTCQAGICTGGNPVTCAAQDQCHGMGTCDTQTGACSNPQVADGTACNDGNACMQTDTCQLGLCIGGNPVTCSASDQCHDAGTCDPRTGACSNPPVADGTTCDDANACTQADLCQLGICVGGSSVTCSAIDQCHDAGTCDPQTGFCSDPPVADGSVCDDGDACTQADLCQLGSCIGGSSVTCSAIDQCHDAGTCDPRTGICSDPQAADGSTCDDGDLCTQGDVCLVGVCTAGLATSCVPIDVCHLAGTCDPTTGACSNPSQQDGASCDDANACTRTDTCLSGSCVGGNSVICSASDQCHSAGTCNQQTGACTNPAVANGTVCNDGSACTPADVCQSGICSGTNPVVCPVTDQCHTQGICSPLSGTCSNPAKPDGAVCDDGIGCASGDTCQAGACTAGPGPGMCPVAIVEADATVKQSNPSRNYGSSSVLEADKGGSTSENQVLLRLRFSGLAGQHITSAKLRLFTANSSISGGRVRLLNGCSWSESEVTWNTKPGLGSIIDSKNAITKNQRIEFDVTNALSDHDGTYCIAIDNIHDGADYNSKESKVGAPELVIETDCGCTPLSGVVQADATVVKTSPAANFGSAASLDIDGDPTKQVFVRLLVSGIGSRTVKSARLRLQVASVSGANSNKGGRIRLVAPLECGWEESTINWINRPTIVGRKLSSVGSVTRGQLVEFNITKTVNATKDGLYCFRIDSGSVNGARYNSMQGPLLQPEAAIILSP